MTLALDEKVAALETALVEAGLAHAFGGAIALAYYATPRGTHDVDINLFVPASRFERVLEVLLPLGVAVPTPRMRKALERDDQVRLFWDATPLDLFFSYTALHDACSERQRRVAFGTDQITILSAEDLSIFKVLFDREKDWRDLAELMFSQGESFDADYVSSWLDRILEADDARQVRYRALRSDDPPAPDSLR